MSLNTVIKHNNHLTHSMSSHTVIKHSHQKQSSKTQSENTSNTTSSNTSNTIIKHNHQTHQTSNHQTRCHQTHQIRQTHQTQFIKHNHQTHQTSNISHTSNTSNTVIKHIKHCTGWFIFAKPTVVDQKCYVPSRHCRSHGHWCRLSATDNDWWVWYIKVYCSVYRLVLFSQYHLQQNSSQFWKRSTAWSYCKITIKNKEIKKGHSQ